MSQITKRALEQSLKNLLREKPLSKITVTDITEDCGISRMTFYYHFKDQFPKVNEWWAYTGEGAPQAPAEGETGWENWVKIAEKSYDTDNMTLDEKKAVYEAGQVQELDGSVKAQYYRFVCRKGIQYKDEQPADKQDHWRNTAFSLSEVTFWQYE